ncbi:hypothetical protein H310_08725 [Aphanomyces invadans]|uniref:Phospholipid/glycerol acyltransferase domain-containing protein n=1 Tax=Aphanomyces invadans TaxID=157072 RepID=A0A024TZ23_9STRA|nr:hypothetical protein H310_08725 [Aphanomyces invadans]ETV98607.1 hypothetical protein H310_08725 [Aphanomyces invadans]|eukprot:XP_008872804.1 hypothetical protein H310_08725 [Aphanomyces invadans]
MVVVHVVLLTAALAIIALHGYGMLSNFLRFACHLYFRRITVHGVNHLPREGPVVVCPNHPNMMIDVLLVLTQCTHMGRNPYAWAKASMFKNPIAGRILRALGAVPVFRPPGKFANQDVDSEKTPEEIAAATRHMFEDTWKVLHAGHLVVLFPEGTSYTLPHMLELRTGVMRVATGFVKAYDTPITVVPVGLTYFNKDHFRSEVSLEFGEPIVVDQSVIQTDAFRADERAEVKRLTGELQERMHRVTLNAHDFESFRVARTIRRLYCAEPLHPKDDVHFTQQLVDLVEGKLTAKETETVVLTQLKADVTKYQHALDDLRIKDSDLLLDVKESLVTLAIERLMYLLVLLPVATPGLLLNLPFYFLGTKLNVLAGYTESRSMFKLAAGIVLVPAQWIVLISTAACIYGSSAAYVLMIALPFFLYSHIRVLEESRTIMENVWYLANLATRKERIESLRTERKALVTTVQNLVNALVKDPVIQQIKKVNSSPALRPAGLSLRYRQESRSAFV